jgi:uncharacterized membrane protein
MKENMMQSGMMHGHMSSAGMWGMMLFMVVGGLLFLAAVGLVIYWVFRKPRQEDAVTVLRRRLAEGAITDEEYRQCSGW